MILTAENYYSQEANREYLSVSQYKDFVGTIGRPGCEEQAIAKLNGEWEMEKTTALMVGSYVDSHFEGSLATFKAKNPDIFTKQGQLKADYRQAEEIINRIERDELFMKYMSGEKQVVMTAELYGAKWKVKLDSYLPGKAIVDLKIMRELHKAEYAKDYGYM
ncbi:MAG: PD-(D/E)XK nuclease-like domain-containing protein, partial [Acetivibrio ethanolgignens]